MTFGFSTAFRLHSLLSGLLCTLCPWTVNYKVSIIYNKELGVSNNMGLKGLSQPNKILIQLQGGYFELEVGLNVHSG